MNPQGVEGLALRNVKVAAFFSVLLLVSTLSGGFPGKRAQCATPVGPSGIIAYASGGDIWAAQIVGGAVKERKRLTQDGASSNPRWSHDGSKLLWERDKGNDMWGIVVYDYLHGIVEKEVEFYGSSYSPEVPKEKIYFRNARWSKDDRYFYYLGMWSGSGGIPLCKYDLARARVLGNLTLTYEFEVSGDDLFLLRGREFNERTGWYDYPVYLDDDPAKEGFVREWTAAGDFAFSRKGERLAVVDVVSSSDSTPTGVSIYNLNGQKVKQLLVRPDLIQFSSHDDFLTYYEEGSDSLFYVEIENPGNVSTISLDIDRDGFIVNDEYDWRPPPTWRAGIQKGDILLHRSGKWGLSNVLTYTHAGIYVGGGLVAEARSEGDGGVSLYPVEDWDFPKDTYVSLYRVNATQAKREAAAAWARAQTERVPRPTYDWGWYMRDASANSSAWYCSELVWASYRNQGIDLKEVGALGPTQALGPVSPDDLAKQEKEDGDLARVIYHHEENPTSIWPGIFLRADSPVDLSLRDPRGRICSKESLGAIPAHYLEMDVDGDGESEDLILLEKRLLGDYRVTVIPEQGASPEDTFTLIARVRGERTVLARDMKISQIPARGFLLEAPEKTWYLAEGCTAAGMQTYILVQNPGSDSAHVKLTFQTKTGEVQGPEVDLPGGRRTTFLANTYVPGNTDVSTKVTSDRPVICERAMYGAGMAWAHDSMGYNP